MVYSVSGETWSLHLKLCQCHSHGNDCKLKFLSYFHCLALPAVPPKELTAMVILTWAILEHRQTVPDHSPYLTSSPHSPHKAPAQSSTMLSPLTQMMVPSLQPMVCQLWGICALL